MSHRWVSIITGIVFIGLFSGTTAALAAYPYVFTAWKKITISQDECVRRATNVLRNNNYTGMTAGIKGNDTMLGGLGDYVGALRRQRWGRFLRCHRPRTRSRVKLHERIIQRFLAWRCATGSNLYQFDLDGRHCSRFPEIKSGHYRPIAAEGVNRRAQWR